VKCPSEDGDVVRDGRRHGVPAPQGFAQQPAGHVLPAGGVQHQAVRALQDTHEGQR
jgi:hypothetical protein